MTRRTAILLSSTLTVTRFAAAFQEKRLSPHETASVDLNGKQITITYGRPYLKHRQFGKDVAPNGEVWRLGADEATKLTLPSAAKIQGGPELKAGSYSLWAIPGPDKWTMIVNKQADVWGTNYDQSQDVGRFDLPVHKTSSVEEFTISLTKQSANSAEVSFAWGTEKVAATITLV